MMRRDTVPGAGTFRPGHPRATRAFRAALGVLLAALALALAPAARADAVAAPSDAAALALEQRSSKGCSVDGFHTVFRGTLPGAAVPVTIATFAVEGCGGGSNGGGSFGVFGMQGGAVVEWPQAPAPAGRVSEVVVRGDQLVVRWMTFRPADPMCCPSEPHRAVYRLSDGKVILTR